MTIVICPKCGHTNSTSTKVYHCQKCGENLVGVPESSRQSASSLSNCRDVVVTKQQTYEGNTDFREAAYLNALILSISLTAASGILILGYGNNYHGTLSDLVSLVNLNSLVPLLTVFITSISTLSAIFLGWRLDRRQARELELKTKDLELKIKELELKLASAPVSSTQLPTQQFPNF